MLWLIAAIPAAADDTLRIGSKRFTESYILGELLAQAAAPHVRTEHKQGLGNTAIVLAALKAGEIDVYPEYTGTIALEILKHPQVPELAQMRRELAALGLGIDVPLGFNNTYALAVRGGTAGARTVGDLARQGGYRFGLSHEFIGRADGWPGLARRYGLTQPPRGLDHGIAYEALQQRQVDVIDIYSTDAKIRQYGLHVLEDDRGYFPRYDAVLLYRLDAAQRFPAAWQALRRLQGRIPAGDMIAMNAAAEIDGKDFASIARAWLAVHPVAQGGAVSALPAGTARATAGGPDAALTAALPLAAKPEVASATAPPLVAKPDVAPATARARDAAASRPALAERLFADDFWPLTRQHVTLVVLSVALACLFGIPLGVLAAYVPAVRQPVMALAGVLQTIPSLALLAMLIPLMGSIGTGPALVALVVYALLPIVRNTCTGLAQVPDGLKLAAQALGLRAGQRLRHVELPLAMPVLLAGVKTAAVMSVGTATIAALIGAGGYGERITTGLALNDQTLLLAGAIPAAALALLVQGAFEVLEKLSRKQM
ncbi:ABC transporter permease subunit [Duganella ginsengisoli]|uniref:ABC transporter permease subunit n=1 Tax=Pseudoduganella ginsengisoli TaxID=1462440 RepID=A0A6L6PU88_9BURK|nr:glycine betaine ABC transporter substrate-binding protein [Pseudoduganella ginsengisoli]MTW01080.1 ABC transporter permease subunit [Pseudoduganella ginsengisoli]